MPQMAPLPYRELQTITVVMAGLVPAIHVLIDRKGVDARDKPGHDEREFHCK
jgi:hypothetical protein